MWQRTNPFIIGRHTEKICEAIDKAIDNYSRGVSSFLAIKIPFRHGKSDIVSRYLPANFIGKYPDDEIIVTGYAYPLVRSFSRFSRGLLKDSRYQLVYPGVFLSREHQSVDDWAIQGRHGEAHWVGLGGPATGKGGSLIVIDDFFKNRREAESEVVRDTVWESVSNDILTRRAPVCIVIILATPWHIDDVFGRIDKKRQENPEFPEFEEIRMPAFSDSYPTGVLFPERFSGAWYRAEKAILGPYASAGLLQCDPIARGGNIFEVDKIKTYEKAPEGIRWCRGWDLASTEEERVSEDPDYTAGPKVGVRWIPLNDDVMVPEVYVDDLIDGRWAAPKRNERIKETAIGDGPRTQIAVEAYGPYKDAYEEVRKALTGIRIVKKMQLPGDKLSKASVLEPIISAGNFYIKKAPWNERFLEQFRQFPGGAHDDIVDGVVVGFEGHDPYETRIWPQFQERHIMDLNINWNRTKSDPDGILHYASVWQKEDLTIWVILALWDAYKGYLFIYDAFTCGEPIPGMVAPMLIDRMRMKQFKSDAIICNKLMHEEKGFSKNIAIQYRKELQKRKITTRVTEAFNYDEFASMIEVGQLFDMNMIYVDSSVKSFILQVMSWVTVDRGRHKGKRPDVENDGFCRAMCILDSELRRKTRWAQIMKPKFADYNKDKIVQDTYNKMAQIGAKREDVSFEKEVILS